MTSTRIQTSVARMEAQWFFPLCQSCQLDKNGGHGQEMRPAVGPKQDGVARKKKKKHGIGLAY